ncbi:hypothetical protein BJ742DRAFT_802010 [Cladochytrium replicatum]|nr:hypothetical protein BJ742DRAFT_802010 [Cladochytrium replicatum]
MPHHCYAIVIFHLILLTKLCFCYLKVKLKVSKRQISIPKFCSGNCAAIPFSMIHQITCYLHTGLFSKSYHPCCCCGPDQSYPKYH